MNKGRPRPLSLPRGDKADVDYYDMHFDTLRPGVTVWKRCTQSTFPTTRKERFLALTRAEMNVVPWGSVAEMASIEPFQVVVYMETNGRRKRKRRKNNARRIRPVDRRLMLHKDAFIDFPDNTCSLYLPSPQPTVAISRREIMVGSEAWMLEYESTEDWASDVASATVVVSVQRPTESNVNTMQKLMRFYETPTLAIDYVPCDATWYAINFDLAPRLRGTGLEDVMPPEKAHRAIYDAFWAIKDGTF